MGSKLFPNKGILGLTYSILVNQTKSEATRLCGWVPDDITMIDPDNEPPPFHLRPISVLPKTQTAASVSPSHQDNPYPPSLTSQTPPLLLCQLQVTTITLHWC